MYQVLVAGFAVKCGNIAVNNKKIQGSLQGQEE